MSQVQITEGISIDPSHLEGWSFDRTQPGIAFVTIRCRVPRGGTSPAEVTYDFMEGGDNLNRLIDTLISIERNGYNAG